MTCVAKSRWFSAGRQMAWCDPLSRVTKSSFPAPEIEVCENGHLNNLDSSGQLKRLILPPGPSRTQFRSTWASAHLPCKTLQSGDAILHGWVGQEQVVHARSGQRIDDEQVRGGRNVLRRYIGNYLCGLRNPGQRGSQRARLSGDARAALVGRVFPGTADGHLNEHAAMGARITSAMVPRMPGP